MKRDRFIDTIRVTAVLVVVFGHWTATSVTWDDGGIVGDSALAAIPESHPATWLLQVMPLLFYVGGFANARSFAQHTTYLGYLRTRLQRLLRPTLVFVAVWLIVAVVGDILPLSLPNLLDRGADIAALPFWFVGLYVVVVAIAPAMLQLHRQWRWRVPLALAGGTVVVDVLVHVLGLSGFGVCNYFFVWLLPHQMGFFHDERPPVPPARLWAVSIGGLTGLIALTAIGGYPVSMVFVPGADRGNTEPPSLAIVALSAFLIAGALLARPWLDEKDGNWVARLNRVPLSLYLWHVSAIPIAVAILYPLGFPQHPIGSTEWWLWRPVWLLTLACVLTAIVAAVARFETHPDAVTPQLAPDRRRRPLAIIGVALVAISLLGFGVTGFNRPLADTGEGLLGFTLNPALNTLHLIIGLAVLFAVLAVGSGALTSVAGGGATLLVIGLAGMQGGFNQLGSNIPTATLDVAIGAMLMLASVPLPAQEPSQR